MQLRLGIFNLANYTNFATPHDCTIFDQTGKLVPGAGLYRFHDNTPGQMQIG